MIRESWQLFWEFSRAHPWAVAAVIFAAIALVITGALIDRLIIMQKLKDREVWYITVNGHLYKKDRNK